MFGLSADYLEALESACAGQQKGQSEGFNWSFAIWQLVPQFPHL